jgi:hypothetical protein
VHSPLFSVFSSQALTLPGNKGTKGAVDITANSREGCAELAKRVVAVDNRVVRVMVMSSMAELLAVRTSRAIPRKSLPPPSEMIRRASAFTVAYEGAEGATKWLGKMHYTVFAYEGYKILLLRVPHRKNLLSIRLPRDANAEEVYLKVTNLLIIGYSSTNMSLICFLHSFGISSNSFV